MSIYKELSYDHEIDPIKGIRFSVLSPEEILQNSVAEIFKTDTYVGTEPVVNGLFDPRMGVLDHNKVCQTCEQKMVFCPGHFGHIDLAKPVFYIQFFDYVKKILKCVCFRCSKLLINPESAAVQACLNKKISRQKRWELLYKMSSKIRRCGQENIDGCGAKQPEKITREPIVKIVMEWKDLSDDAKKQVFNAEEVLRILKRISDRDAEILGFSRKYNRPEWMIATRLPVPPPAVRPSVRTDTGQRSEDDLTHKLCDIVKSNNSLKSKIEKKASKEQIDIATQVLQYHVATFIDNNIPGINPAQQRTGRLLKSLTERLKSKDGRIRGNLMGKRVDFSARSVITPDPNISIDELGVPIKIAMNLTFPEIVNQHNRDKLMEFVINGPDVYPGAKFIRKKDRTIGLKNMVSRDSIQLEDGDVVDRHMLDGDPVLFNRQPSLHKYSMMCHRAKIMPFNTFRLNVCSCSCYNADFDGDEMNMHLPQSLVTASELQDLAAVANQIISVRECKPIISIVQDVALGVYRFTKPTVYLTEKQAMNLLSSNPKGLGMLSEPSHNQGDVRKWSGRQIMSTIIPPNTNLAAPNKHYDETKPDDRENFVVVENGVHKQGIMDKYIYQNRTRGLIHSIFNECNPEETRLFLDNTQKVICDWLVQSGFSVGISDIMIDAKTEEEIKKEVHKMKVDVYDIISQIHSNQFENKSIGNNNEYFETEVNKLLNSAQNKVGKIAKGKINDMENRMINMVNAGSKGQILNVSQMTACLGQVNVDGERIAYGFDDRTLPHYTKFDDGPESRGFVESSFIKGLTPQEFFFHAMGGREGLIDTAVKTSETGYIQRKLVKAMEDAKINYDYTVRNASGSIIQFLYGEDGMDAAKLENQSLTHYIESDFEKLKKEYLLTKEDDLKYYLDDKTLEEFQNTADWEETFKAHFHQVLKDREYIIKDMFDNKKETSLLYPISFQRIIHNAKVTFKDKGMSDLSPMESLKTLKQLEDELYISKTNRGNKLLNILIRCYLSPKKIAMEYKFSKATFEYVIQQVKLKFYDAIAHPSEMVGVIAAQSIGEPSTQMSCVKDTRIKIIGSNNTHYNGPIGDFIDKLITKHEQDVKQVGENSVVLDLSEDYKIIGVSDTEKTSWMRISQVSRHPANGGLVKVTTLSGKTTTATLSHSFLKRTEKGIEPILGSELRVGQRIPVAKSLPLPSSTLNNIDDLQLTRDFGYQFGQSITNIPPWVFAANNEFIQGFLHAIIDNSATFSDDTIQIILSTKDVASDVVVLLSYYGVFANMYHNKIEIKPDNAQALIQCIGAHRPVADFIQNNSDYSDDKFDLIPAVSGFGTISRKELINHIDQGANSELLKQAAFSDVIWDEITELEYLDDPNEYVYDFTVPGNDSFMVDAGVLVHNTLNTFHLSGVSSASKAVRGVPRIKELLSVTRNIKTPALTIFLKDEYSQDKKKARDVMNTIQTTYFADIVKTSKIYYDPNDFQTTIKEDQLFLKTYKEFIDQGLIDVKNLSPWLLRLEFDKDKMLEYNIQMIDVYNALEEFYDDHISAMFSDDNAKELIFRIKIHEPDDKHEDIITDLKALEKNIMENLIVKGVKKISKVIMNKQEFFAYDEDSMSFNKMFEWVLETSGTNLIDMFAHRAVDHSRTISNDINEIYETLGIEAARQALFNEISDVIKFADLYVNYRHLALLVDTMTNKGYMLSIDRHGINRVDIGPLAKSSFEETNDMIVKAGIFAEMDKINGVSANIMLGQIPPAGTGDTDILIDEAILPNKFVPEKQLVEPEDAEAVCDNLCIDYSLPSTSTAAPKKMKEQKLKFV